MSARRKPKLPPLVRYQVDLLNRASGYGNAWMMAPATYFTIKDAREDWQSRDYAPGCLLVIRRLSDGKIVWLNQAAKEAGL